MLPIADDRALIVRSLGALELARGRLVVADPQNVDAADDYGETPTEMLEHSLFEARFASNRAEVFAHREAVRGGLTALVEVRFSEEGVAAWALAHRRGEDPRLLRPGQFFGTPIDTAMIAVIDPDRATTAEPSVELGDRCLSRGTPPWALAVPSGAGDGIYPSYLGLAADGRAARLVIDLRILRMAWPQRRDEPEHRRAHVARVMGLVTAGCAAHPEWREPAKRRAPGAPIVIDRELGHAAAQLRSLSEFGSELGPVLPHIVALADHPRLGRHALLCLDVALREEPALAAPWRVEAAPAWLVEIDRRHRPRVRPRPSR